MFDYRVDMKIIFLAVILALQPIAQSKPKKLTTKQGFCRYRVQRKENMTPFLQEHHYDYGKVYGMMLETGKVFSDQPAKRKVVYMCRYHIAGWIGHDPETGEKYAYGEPEKAAKE